MDMILYVFKFNELMLCCSIVALFINELALSVSWLSISKKIHYIT